MKYLLLGYTAAQEWDESDVSAEEIARVCREYDALEQRLRDIGEFVAAEGLADHSQTVTVSSRDGVAVATDGPFIEAKESMVSYLLVDVASRERAVEIGSALVDLYGQTCEVRPVMEMDVPPDL
jgi:hypothetical protein